MHNIDRNNIKIGIRGFDKRRLKSVERMRFVLLNAVQNQFQAVDRSKLPIESNGLDALLTFYDPAVWENPNHPQYPLLFCINGDLIARFDFIRCNLSNLKTSDALLVACNSDKSILYEILGQSTPIVRKLPYYIDTDIYQQMDRRHCREHILNTLSIDWKSRQTYIIAFVGRLIPQKNLHRFIKLIKSVKDRLKHVNIIGVVAGSYTKPYPVLDYFKDDYRAYCSELQQKLGLERNIFFLGELIESELSTLYNASDLLVVLTNNVDENFGFTAIESMACGTPVVATAYGGLKDTILPGVTGQLVPTWLTATGIRFDQIYAEISVASLLLQAGRRSEMSKASSQHVQENYSRNCFDRTVQKIIHEVISCRDSNHKWIETSYSPDLPSQKSRLPPCRASLGILSRLY